ncbi:HAD family hydrolase [Georgenia sp. Z1344]|uniref:HAD family hydrolase n=1 Tax=Georgenia sp. Z1344 TaxID=3416706 RepID=UPI003CF91E1B
MTIPDLPEAVLWDMDGTIIDSEPVWFVHQKALIEELGGRWSDERSQELLGLNLEDAARVMIDEGGIDAEPATFLDELVGRVVAHVRAEGVDRRPGAFELIAQLREARVPQALVTASYAPFAETVAELAGGFDVVVPGDRVERGKPDPEGYLLAARLLGADIERCVAIEDSPNGLRAARASGARCLGVPHMSTIPHAAGLSRVASLADVDLETIRDIGLGRAVDLLAA